MKAFRGSPLFASIAATIGAYGALEAIVFYSVAAAFGFSHPFLLSYLCVQFFFHAGLGFFLVGASSLFYNVMTGEHLTRVNAANKITLLRISMLPFILFLIIAARNFSVGPILIPALAITFITDLIDGRISRTRNQITQIGKILDSVSDYSLLIVVAVAYFVYELLPPWLFWIIVSRLFFQAVGMAFLLLVRKKIEPRPTIPGKVAVATIMSLFAAEALKLVLPGKFLDFFSYIEAAAGITVALSIIDKGIYFYKEARSASDRASQEKEKKSK